MSANGPTLRERYAADLRSGSTPVLVTAVLAAVGLVLASALYAPQFEYGFLLALLVGVQVPMAHERHWPTSGGWMRDVGWTLAASATALAVFVSVALCARSVDVAPLWGAVTAFVVATLAVSLGIRRVARRRS